MTRPVHICGADLVLLLAPSLTKHGITVASIPPGKTIIHATNDERDINKSYRADHPILGDAKLVLGQFVEAARIYWAARTATPKAAWRRRSRRARKVAQGMAAQAHLQ